MRILVPLLAILTASCSTYEGTAPVYSVKQAVENVRALKGQRIVVVGYLADCQPLGCSLSDGRFRNSEYSLGLGHGPDFDRQVNKYAGRRVAVEADYTADCVDEDPTDDILYVCTDRATSLENPTVIGPPYLVSNRMNK